jgi:Ni/Co efflux regulator RcnB
MPRAIAAFFMGDQVMRKIILAALAVTTLTPAIASAQSYGDPRQDHRDDRRDDRRDGQRDYRDNGGQDRRDVRDDRGQGYGYRHDGAGFRDDRGGPRGDWRDYRRSNPEAFRRGGYRGPGGYRYRAVTPGYRFAPSYYGRNYWVNDWQNYRLARPLGYQRWVRYGNDVVLVDIRNGAVVSVFNSFFF